QAQGRRDHIERFVLECQDLGSIHIDSDDLARGRITTEPETGLRSHFEHPSRGISPQGVFQRTKSKLLADVADEAMMPRGIVVAQSMVEEEEGHDRRLLGKAARGHRWVQSNEVESAYP